MKLSFGAEQYFYPNQFSLSWPRQSKTSYLPSAISLFAEEYSQQQTAETGTSVQIERSRNLHRGCRTGNGVDFLKSVKAFLFILFVFLSISARAEVETTTPIMQPETPKVCMRIGVNCYSNEFDFCASLGGTAELWAAPSTYWCKYPDGSHGYPISRSYTECYDESGTPARPCGRNPTCPDSSWTLSEDKKTCSRNTCDPAKEIEDPQSGKCLPKECPPDRTLDTEGNCQCKNGLIEDPATAACIVAPAKDNGPQTCETQQSSPSTPLPITIGTGNKWLLENDFGRGNRNGFLATIPFIRIYNSNPDTIGSILGARWRMSYDQNIATDTGRSYYWFLRSNGRSYQFSASNNNSGNTGASTGYLFTKDVNHQLQRDAGGSYRIFTEDQALENYDNQGRLSAITAPSGVTTSLSYNKDTWLISEIKDTLGRSLSFDYEIVKIKYNKLVGTSSSGGSGSGSMMSILEHPIKRLKSVTSNTHGTVRYGYDDSNNLIKVTYPDGSTKTYHYEDSKNPHALTGMTDESGVRIMTYGYDDQGRAVSEHSPAVDGVNRYTLSFNGNATTVTDPISTERTYQFTTINDVAKNTGQSQPGGSGCGPASLSNQYDAHGNLTRSTDFKGNVTTYTYDLDRNLETKRIEAVGTAEQRTITTTWHSYWRMPVQIAEPNKITTYIYNGDTDTGTKANCSPGQVMTFDGSYRPNGVLCKRIEQATTDTNGSQGINATATGTPRIWSYTYNSVGQITKVDGPRTDVADTTTYSYHSTSDAKPGKRSQLYQITNALGQITSIDDYDARGNPIRVTDTNNIPTTLEYDARNQLTRINTDGQITDYQYTATGLLDRITLPDGSTLYYTYDLAHRLTDITDSLGNRIHYTLDVMGNRLQENITDPQGTLSQTHRRAYDPLNRLYQSIGAQNQTTTYEYDANGNQTKVTDPLNHSSTYAFDALNRLIKSIDPNNGQTNIAWNGQDQLTQVTDPRNLKTTYTIDGLGNQTQLDSPDTGITTSTYDSAGNLISKTDAKNQTTTYKYDALNRLTLLTDHKGNQIRYTYDQNTNGKGRLSKIEEVDGNVIIATTQYTYDSLGRLVSETRTFTNNGNSIAHTQHYTYTNGKLTKQTFPSGRQLAYEHNAAGQITRLTLTDTRGQEEIIASDITYHPFGGVKNWIDGAGKPHQKVQDKDGRIASYALGNNTWQLSYDEGSRIIAQMDTKNAAQSVSYGYDNLNRLTGAQLPNISYSYGYDATGNRTSQLMGSVSQTHMIDQNSNRISSTTGNQPRSYAYDLTGNLTGDGQITSTYDVRGRLQQTNTAAGVTTYRINALGQRIQKTASGTDIYYHYDQSGQLIAESDNDGKVTREYLWIGNTPIAVIE